MRWAGADVVLGPLIEPGDPLAERFELRDLTLVRRVERDGDVVTGVTVEDLRTKQTSFVPADLVVVAADAFRSPQLAVGHPTPRRSGTTSPSTRS